MPVLRPVLRDVFQPVLRGGAGGFVPQTGPELVVNGGFADGTGWTASGQWAIADAKASHTGPGTETLRQSIAIVVGRSYTVTFTILEASVAGDGMSFFLGQTTGTIRSAPGTYTQTVVPALGTNLDFVARGVGGDWAGSIDNVSVKESFY